MFFFVLWCLTRGVVVLWLCGFVVLLCCVCVALWSCGFVIRDVVVLWFCDVVLFWFRGVVNLCFLMLWLYVYVLV